MDDCTRIDDHCELLRESPRQWYLSYNSYCMSFARLCKRQNYRTQESDDKQKSRLQCGDGWYITFRFFRGT